MQAAVYFDLDHTLLPRQSAEQLFVRALIRQRRLGPRGLWRSLAEAARTPGGWRLEAWKRNKAYLADQPAAELEVLARELVHSRVLPRLSPRALLTMAYHRDRGDRLVLLTGSLDFLARPVAEHLKIEDVLATALVRRDGLFSGALEPPHPRGAGKLALLERHSRENRIDLAESFAYADDLSDLPVLQAVGNPRPVNANPRLARAAHRFGWTVLNW